MSRDTSHILWSDYFTYDEESPSCLRWKVDKRGGKNHNVVVKAAGEVAGSLCKHNLRWDIGLNNELYKAHRVVWEIHFGSIPEGFVIDHIDRDATNNKVENLRTVPQVINTRNASLRCDNKSSICGVTKTSKFSRGKTYFYYTCQWSLLGEKGWKHFSVSKLGYEEAFRLACEYRAKMIEELNAQGAGYTERHGT